MTEADNSQTKALRPFSIVFKDLMDIMWEYVDHPETPARGVDVFTRIWDIVAQCLPEYGGDAYSYYFPEELDLEELDLEDDET